MLDQNLSPAIADRLTASGHDAMHIRHIGLSRAPDEQVLAAAHTDGRVLISSDTDFGELLSRSQADAPSVLLLRRQANRRAEEIAGLILANLDAIADDLQAGSIVVLDDTRLRIRRLPIGGSSATLRTSP